MKKSILILLILFLVSVSIYSKPKKKNEPPKIERPKNVKVIANTGATGSFIQTVIDIGIPKKIKINR